MRYIIESTAAALIALTIGLAGARATVAAWRTDQEGRRR